MNECDYATAHSKIQLINRRSDLHGDLNVGLKIVKMRDNWWWRPCGVQSSQCLYFGSWHVAFA